MARMFYSSIVEGEYDMEEVKGKLFPLDMGMRVWKRKKERGRVGSKTSGC